MTVNRRVDRAARRGCRRGPTPRAPSSPLIAGPRHAVVKERVHSMCHRQLRGGSDRHDRVLDRAVRRRIAVGSVSGSSLHAGVSRSWCLHQDHRDGRPGSADRAHDGLGSQHTAPRLQHLLWPSRLRSSRARRGARRQQRSPMPPPAPRMKSAFALPRPVTISPIGVAAVAHQAVRVRRRRRPWS